jgi:hypothetical protein
MASTSLEQQSLVPAHLHAIAAELIINDHARRAPALSLNAPASKGVGRQLAL